MHMRTGETAGEIWRILEAKGPLTLGKLTQAVRKDTKTMLMGLGWLLREDKISIEEKGNAWRISLK